MKCPVCKKAFERPKLLLEGWTRCENSACPIHLVPFTDAGWAAVWALATGKAAGISAEIYALDEINFTEDEEEKDIVCPSALDEIMGEEVLSPEDEDEFLK